MNLFFKKNTIVIHSKKFVCHAPNLSTAGRINVPTNGSQGAYFIWLGRLTFFVFVLFLKHIVRQND